MKKAGWIVVVAALIALPVVAFWPRKAETDVSKVRRVVGLASLYHTEEALDLLHSLRDSHEIDGLLGARLEVAIRLAMLADRYDMWEGSSFGQETPWETIDDIFWSFPIREEFGGPKPPRAFEEKDCDRVIKHSLNRLRRVALRKLKEQTP